MVASLGRQLDEMIEYLTVAAHKIEPKTLIHGDYKISNVFLNKEISKVYTIDWQWMGIGCGVTDVAHFLYTRWESKRRIFHMWLTYIYIYIPKLFSFLFFL